MNLDYKTAISRMHSSVKMKIAHWLGLVAAVSFVPALATPIRDLAVREPLIAVEEGTALALRDPRLQTRRRDVALGLITSNTAIALAACAFGGPFTCAGVAIAAVLTNFFTFYLSRSNGPGGSPVRSLDMITETAFHEKFAPTADCSVACKLDAANVPAGEWLHIGNTVANGIDHEIHHMRNGSINGLRAIQKSTSHAKDRRQDQDSEGGFIGDYYWIAPNPQAYGDFHSTSSIIQSASNDVTNYVQRHNGLEVCVDFGDDTGELNEGVLTLGWNNQPFLYSSIDVLESHLASCQLGELFHSGTDVEDDDI
ncbi:hypothetical protein Hypma_000299 [Hypsizygus marmoreus]|uniref:Uncharacterized protein n=1 Tax=Hypsizygus marmoreus TaxID=39966 RepID=A0A369JI05_HYPMA|nr:hypothetical protein Hypma_000299 [Hypsizygus marmoreus]